MVHSVGGTKKTVQRLLAAGKCLRQGFGRNLPPNGGRVHLLVRQNDLAETYILMRVVTNFFIACHAPNQMNLTQRNDRRKIPGGIEFIQNFKPSVIDCIRIIIGAGFLHERFTSFPVKPLHLIGGGLNHIDRTLIEGQRSACIVDFSDYYLAA